MDQWRSEFEEEQRRRQEEEDSGWVILLFNDVTHVFKTSATRCCKSVWNVLSYAEVLVSNMPLTIGALGLSWVTQGVIWFKFMEENIGSCTTVHFHSPQCTYPEFPGCFDCDISDPIYQLTITFHYFCHCVAATCCLLFFGKCILAWRVVVDELSNPATSTPMGVVCITIICVAAGRGWIGEVIVLVTSAFHLLLSFWFLFMAIVQFRLWPDPGWFPNTVGIAYAAVKTWLYFPIPGLFLMSVSNLGPIISPRDLLP